MNTIVAVDQNWAIGHNGQLLYHISDDLNHFRELTTDHCIIYGRKTLETFPGKKPLPHRENVILTRNLHYQADATIAHSLNELRRIVSSHQPSKVDVIGGAEIYNLLLPYCDTAYVTKILDAVPNADAHFPNLDLDSNWELTDEGPIRYSEGFQFRFCTYHNRHPLTF